MSSKRERLQYYYDLHINKHQASGLGENQLRVYKEIKEIVAPYETGEEVAKVLKESGYQEKPAQALYQDMLLAHARAYDELSLHDVAEVYKRKEKEVAADYAQAHVTGWDQEVNKELAKIHNIASHYRDAFQEFFYVQGLTTTHPDYEKHLTRTKEAVANIEKEGETLEGVASKPYYQKMIPYSPELQQQKIAEMRAAFDAPIPDAEEKTDFESRAAEAIKFVKENKSDMQELNKDFNARSRRATFIVIAPEENPGPYTVEEFYMGPQGQ